MSILQKIKDDLLAARKAGKVIERSLLTTVLSEVQMIGKNDGGRDTTDAETIAYLKKMIKNTNDTIGHVPADSTGREVLVQEVAILSSYLPQQMTEEQIQSIIEDLKDKAYGVPEIMKYFKEKHAGFYDGAFVSKLARG